MRPSALNLAMKCRGSYLLGKGEGDGDGNSRITNQHARLGNAFHELAKAKVLRGQADVNAITSKYGLTQEEIDDLLRMLSKIEINIPANVIVYCEERLQSIILKLSGTPDFFTINEETRHADLTDWKSGFMDVEPPESNWQMISYAFMIIEIFDVDTVTCALVMPRRSEIKSFTFTRGFIESMKDDLVACIKESEQPDAPIVTGPWCYSCFASMKCPAFSGEIVKLSGIMFPEVLGFTKDVAVEESLKRALPFVKAFQRIATRVEGLAKAYVDIFGPLELGGGLTYSKETVVKQEIDSQTALPILRVKFSPDEVDKAIKITKTAIESLAKKTGERGAFPSIMRELDSAGAMKEKPTTQYAFTKKGEPINGTAITDNRND